MKKSLLFLATLVIISSFSCRSKSGKRLPADDEVVVVYNPEYSTEGKARDEIKMDSIFNQVADSLNNFINTNIEYFAHTHNNEIFWDSKNPQDIGFQNIRLNKKIAGKIIIERRSNDRNMKDVVLGYTIGKQYDRTPGSPYPYYVESTYFKDGKEILKETKRESIQSEKDMEIATEIFRKRLKEAAEFVSTAKARKETVRQTNIQLMSENG